MTWIILLPTCPEQATFSLIMRDAVPVIDSKDKSHGLVLLDSRNVSFQVNRVTKFVYFTFQHIKHIFIYDFIWFLQQICEVSYSYFLFLLWGNWVSRDENNCPKPRSWEMMNIPALTLNSRLLTSRHILINTIIIDQGSRCVWVSFKPFLLLVMSCYLFYLHNTSQIYPIPWF